MEGVPICTVVSQLGVRVAPNSFCAARSHPLSACSTRDETLTNATRRMQNENYCVFDMRKMHVFLNSETLAVEHVARYTVEHWN